MTSTIRKAFMDDMFLKSPSIPATQVLLNCCAVALICARMSFRVYKYKPVVIYNGKVIHISPFSYKGDIIPSIHANAIRFFGRTIDFNIVTEAFSGLKLKGKCSHKNPTKYVNTEDFIGLCQYTKYPSQLLIV